MTLRILSFFLTKDRVATENYDSLVRQEGVEQDIVIVSAKPVGFDNNFVYAVNQEYDLTIRVGLSIDLRRN
jgi:hypothetical protein